VKVISRRCNFTSISVTAAALTSARVCSALVVANKYTARAMIAVPPVWWLTPLPLMQVALAIYEPSLECLPNAHRPGMTVLADSRVSAKIYVIFLVE
jgi:hypothetical protein